MGDLRPAPVPVPDAQPGRGFGPGRRPGGRLRHADLVAESGFESTVKIDVTIRREEEGGVSHLLQAAAGLIGQGVRAGALGREQGEAGAHLTSRAAASVGQPVGAALVEV